MITIIILASCYVLIGALIYDTARTMPMDRRYQLLYSVIWPWLLMSTATVAVWELIFPPKD
jgi:hypothetical protein